MASLLREMKSPSASAVVNRGVYPNCVFNRLTSPTRPHWGRMVLNYALAAAIVLAVAAVLFLVLGALRRRGTGRPDAGLEPEPQEAG